MKKKLSIGNKIWCLSKTDNIESAKQLMKSLEIIINDENLNKINAIMQHDYISELNEKCEVINELAQYRKSWWKRINE